MILNGLCSSPVDIKAVRLAIAKAIDERGWTQEQVAERAGVQQSHISKIVRVGEDPTELKDLAARIVFDVVEHGLGMSLSSFFAQIEGLKEGPALRQDSLRSFPGEADHGGAVPDSAAAAIGIETLILGLSATIEHAADRVADRLERLTEARPHKTSRRPSRDERRKKAS